MKFIFLCVFLFSNALFAGITCEFYFQNSLFQSTYQIFYSGNNREVAKTIQIYDDTGLKIPFVEVSLLKSGKKLMSDENGVLVLENIDAEEEIEFYAFGYEPLILKYGEIGEKVTLRTSKNELTEVVVKAKNPKERTLGVTKKRTNTTGQIFGDSLGSEVARYIKNNRTVRLKNIAIYIGNFGHEKFKLRARIYDKDLNSLPIYEQIIDSDMAFDWLIIDLPENIKLKDDFYIAFQWLGTNKESDDLRSGIYFGMLSWMSLGNDCYFKKDINSPWLPTQDFDFMIRADALVW